MLTFSTTVLKSILGDCTHSHLLYALLFSWKTFSHTFTFNRNIRKQQIFWFCFLKECHFDIVSFTWSISLLNKSTNTLDECLPCITACSCVFSLSSSSFPVPFWIVFQNSFLIYIDCSAIHHSVF